MARTSEATVEAHPRGGSRSTALRADTIDVTTPGSQASQAQAAAEADRVRSGLGLVRAVAAGYASRVPRSVLREDLVSAGMYGLAQAARSWDDSRGVAFESFARARINGAILDELRSRDWASRGVRSGARRRSEVTEELRNELGREPEMREVAERMGVAVTSLTQLDGDIARATVFSLDKAVEEEGAHGPVTEDVPAESVLNRELQSVLTDAVNALPERLRKVVVEYFFDERPMQAIADDLGVTESRISQMRAEALVLLRDGINSVLDPDQVPDLKETAGRVARRKSAYYAAVASSSTARGRLDARQVLAALAVRTA
jgi:RNA polymerase sigma factor FliA